MATETGITVRINGLEKSGARTKRRRPSPRSGEAAARKRQNEADRLDRERKRRGGTAIGASAATLAAVGLGLANRKGLARGARNLKRRAQGRTVPSDAARASKRWRYTPNRTGPRTFIVNGQKQTLTKKEWQQLRDQRVQRLQKRRLDRRKTGSPDPESYSAVAARKAAAKSKAEEAARKSELEALRQKAATAESNSATKIAEARRAGAEEATKSRLAYEAEQALALKNRPGRRLVQRTKDAGHRVAQDTVDGIDQTAQTVYKRIKRRVGQARNVVADAATGEGRNVTREARRRIKRNHAGLRRAAGDVSSATRAASKDVASVYGGAKAAAAAGGKAARTVTRDAERAIDKLDEIGDNALWKTPAGKRGPTWERWSASRNNKRTKKAVRKENKRRIKALKKAQQNADREEGLVPSLSRGRDLARQNKLKRRQEKRARLARKKRGEGGGGADAHLSARTLGTIRYFNRQRNGDGTYAPEAQQNGPNPDVLAAAYLKRKKKRKAINELPFERRAINISANRLPIRATGVAEKTDHSNSKITGFSAESSAEKRRRLLKQEKEDAEKIAKDVGEDMKEAAVDAGAKKSARAAASNAAVANASRHELEGVLRAGARSVAATPHTARVAAVRSGGAAAADGLLDTGAKRAGRVLAGQIALRRVKMRAASDAMRPHKKASRDREFSAEKKDRVTARDVMIGSGTLIGSGALWAAGDSAYKAATGKGRMKQEADRRGQLARDRALVEESQRLTSGQKPKARVNPEKAREAAYDQYLKQEKRRRKAAAKSRWDRRAKWAKSRKGIAILASTGLAGAGGATAVASLSRRRRERDQ